MEKSDADAHDALAKVLERAVTEMQVDEDDFWDGLDEDGNATRFWKDGRREHLGWGIKQ